MVSDDSESDNGDAAKAYFNLSLLPTSTASSSTSPTGSIGADATADSAPLGVVRSGGGTNAGTADSVASSGAIAFGELGMHTDGRQAHWWCSEVHALASRLRELAAMAPPPQSATIAPALRMESARAASSRLEVLRAEASALRVEASALRAEAEHRQSGGAMKESQEAARAVAVARLAARQSEAAVVAAAVSTSRIAEQRRVAQGRVAAADAIADAVAADADAAAKAARRQAEAFAGQVSALRAAWAKEARAAEAAEAESQRLVTACGNAEDLPAAQSRRQALEQQADGLKEACEQLTQSIEPLRLELAAASRGEKQREREARIDELERDCQRLIEETQEERSINAADQGLDLPYANVSFSELAKAQERNLGLLAEVREVRAKRDRTAGEFQAQQTKIDDERSRRESCKTDVQGLQEQLRWTKEAEGESQKEVEKKRTELKVLERTAADLEEAAKTAREKHQKVDALARKCVQARRKSEEAEALLGFRLQKAVAQMKDENKGDPIIRYLQSDKLGTGQASANVGEAKAPRERWLGGRSTAARDKLDDNLHDAEVSTTAGDESVAEGHDDQAPLRVSPMGRQGPMCTLDD